MMIMYFFGCRRDTGGRESVSHSAQRGKNADIAEIADVGADTLCTAYQGRRGVLDNEFG